MKPPEPSYAIRPHAVRRYVERVKPWLTFARARADMCFLMQDAELDKAPPHWYDGPHADDRKNLIGYLNVSPDVVFVVGFYPGPRERANAQPRVKTVLTRLGADALERRKSQPRSRPGGKTPESWRPKPGDFRNRRLKHRRRSGR